MGFYNYKFFDEKSKEMAIEQRKMKILSTYLVKYEGNYFDTYKQKNNGIYIDLYMRKVTEPSAVAGCSRLEALLAKMDVASKQLDSKENSIAPALTQTNRM